MREATLPKRAFLLDPGLSQPLGHHPNYHQTMAGEFRRRGIQPIHLANRGCVDEAIDGLQVGKLFRLSPYSMLSTDPLMQAWENFFHQASSFEEDLSALKPGFFTPDDIVILVVVSPGTLYGYVQWWGSLPPDARPRTMAIMQMPPGVLSLDPLTLDTNSAVYAGMAQLYRFIGNQIEAFDSGTLYFATATEFLAASYAFLLKRPVGLHPMHLVGKFEEIDPIAEAHERSDAAPIFGCFGDNRIDKGFNLVPGAIEIMLDRHPSLEFLIQIGGSLTTQDSVNKLILNSAERIAQIAARTPRVKLLTGYAGGSDFFSSMARVDFLLLPYSRRPYGITPSGVFSDALSIGRASVVPAHTWMATQIEMLGGFGGRHEAYTSESVAEAALALADRTPELRQSAPELRHIWRGIHGVDRAVDYILGVTGI